MKSTFEKLGGTYKQVGDYLLPDVEAPESPNVGIWVSGGTSICGSIKRCFIPACCLPEI